MRMITILTEIIKSTKIWVAKSTVLQKPSGICNESYKKNFFALPIVASLKVNSIIFNKIISTELHIQLTGISIFNDVHFLKPVLSKNFDVRQSKLNFTLCYKNCTQKRATDFWISTQSPTGSHHRPNFCLSSFKSVLKTE
jgi:hypothetical protein